ncbi:hypothetical protein FKP32DRAFT_1595781 [Trametes sanguinea]|nr:hypothetical protein FKP32DRAFT_1595781 [Trametes sanguinea]
MGRRVTYDTPLSFVEVTARLEKELNKEGAGPNLLRVLYEASKTKEELHNGLREIIGDHQFVYVLIISSLNLMHVGTYLVRRYFFPIEHHHFVRAYTGVDAPQAVVYYFGNPLLGQAILREDLSMGMSTPAKLIVLEKEDGSGTQVVYDDPAATNRAPAWPGKSVSEELARLSDLASEKIDRLLEAVTA